MRLITNQIGTPGAGLAPPGTIGFVPVFVSKGNNPTVASEIDPVRVMRVG
jgi:hypothetical protein